MDEEAWELFWKKLERLYYEKDKNEADFEAEQPLLEKILKKIEEELKEKYELIEPIERGGAGVIIKVKDKRLNFDRALKVPRPKGEKLIESVKNEREYLTKIRHENIISVYDLGDVSIPEFHLPYPYFVMAYIENASDIRKKTISLLETVTESKQLKEITKWVAEKFYEIAEAINFLHQNQIIHFDIKPENILIDENDKPILSDLGFAKKKTEEDIPTVVGFTLFYAHPTLRSRLHSMSSKNRVRTELTPKDFQYCFDVYAFGKSLLEILAVVDMEFFDIVAYDYTFVYLHLAACRMLDGRNLPNSEIENIRIEQGRNGEISAYKETWRNLEARDFKDIRYQCFEEICKDFEKLLRGENFPESIPELNIFYPKRVQSWQGIPAPFTERVKRVVEHPVFQRLAYVHQLGLLNTIYPTASHSRWEHSIGTFGICCQYIQSLYNDPYNPLFRQIIGERDIKCILLASLLHDLGYYPLAHEIEGNISKMRHENLTLKFLDNLTKDKCGDTLQDIIRNPEWGWGLELSDVKDLLKKGSHKNLKHELLSSIIDGPIDADKIDYLLRDSENCYLRYGELIDVDRLIRNLTVIITKEKVFTVGTYEKGQSAAESLIFARYLLYQSLYWHHTARAIRTMLTEAMKHVLQKPQDKKLRGKIKNFSDDFEMTLGIDRKPHNVTAKEILELIERRTDKEGKGLIELIGNRNYYKRILTIHFQKKDGQDLLGRLRKVYNNPGFQDKLQTNIRKSFEEYIDSTGSPRISLLAEERTNEVLEMLSRPGKILCDCPEPIIGTDKQLRFIPEPQRLRKNYLEKAETGDRVSDVWNEVSFLLMSIVSKARIFCHPEIRDTLMVALGPEVIEKCLEKTVKEFES